MSHFVTFPHFRENREISSSTVGWDASVDPVREFFENLKYLKYFSSPTLQVCEKLKGSRYSGVAGVDLQLSSSWGNPVAVGQESGSIFQRNQTTFRPLSTLRLGEKKCFGILIQEKKVRGVFEQNIGNQDSSEDDDYNMAK